MLKQYFRDEPITVHCSNCNSINIKAASEIHAERSGRLVFVAGIAGIFLGFFIVLCTYNNWWIIYGPGLGFLGGYMVDAKQKQEADFFNNSW